MRVPSAVMPHFQNGRAFSDSSTVICRPFACTRSLALRSSVGRIRLMMSSQSCVLYLNGRKIRNCPELIRSSISRLRNVCMGRTVTWLNPTTGEPEPRPIYEVLSSHSARKAFAGNMYKNVKDPNLVGALSGHKEGSRAFARYRVTDDVAEANAKEIDEDMKRDLVSMLE